MKHFFIAYRHTGEDIMELEKRIRTVEIAMATNNVKVYATLFDEKSFQAEHKSAGQIMESAVHKSANTYVHELASHTFVFDDLADLSTKIMGLEL